MPFYGDKPPAFGKLRMQRLRHFLDASADENDIVGRAGGMAA